jgi:hypothetical protein
MNVNDIFLAIGQCAIIRSFIVEYGQKHMWFLARKLPKSDGVAARRQGVELDANSAQANGNARGGACCK